MKTFGDRVDHFCKYRLPLIIMVIGVLLAVNLDGFIDFLVLMGEEEPWFRVFFIVFVLAYSIFAIIAFIEGEKELNKKDEDEYIQVEGGNKHRRRTRE